MFVGLVACDSDLRDSIFVELQKGCPKEEKSYSISVEDDSEELEATIKEQMLQASGGG